MTDRRPLILLSTDYRPDRFGTGHEVRLHADYVTAVERAGGCPLLVPAGQDESCRRRLAEMGHALVLVGGQDIDPAIYGQAPHRRTVPMTAERQTAELDLAHWADRRGLPVLGICLGLQTLNVVRGGTIEQHLPDRYRHGGGHTRRGRRRRPRHMVRIEPGSRLADIVGGNELDVNSSHHQAIDELGADLRAVAWDQRDGFVEAVEGHRADRFTLAVQWHPEELHAEPRHLALFEALVAAAAGFRDAEA